MNIETINNFYQQALQYTYIFTEYHRYFVMAGLVLALLNCFFGYHIRKLWGCILGLFIGAGIGGGAGIYLNQDWKVTVLAAAVGALGLCIAAFIFYKLGILVLSVGSVFFLFYQTVGLSTESNQKICIAIAVVAAIVVLFKERILVILLTGICGGIFGGQFLAELMGIGGASFIGIVLAILGVIFQYQPWKTRKEVRIEQREVEQKQKENKSNKKSKKNKGDGFHPIRAIKDRLPAKKKKKKKNRKVKETTTTTYKQKNTPRKMSNQPKQIQQNKVLPTEEAEDKVVISKNPQNNGKNVNMQVDMTDVHLHISEEIKKIYEDKNNKEE